jgi:hypothetical protein
MATNVKHCKICASDLRDFTKLSPQDHERAHGDDERACGQCWEAWLSLQVEEKKPDEIECLFCKSPISEADSRPWLARQQRSGKGEPVPSP